ncbi:radical SAM/SPASM domain-containing protein [Clostridium cellulovorans]|uniref:Radical SAM domain protein n=1 Tax=Clostridium cellulovorans (strain ATCC 35296 / DSM 3052 / OCM 3 / 743B) TaxID=573061 RepID=D9SMD2_CLOC7|nr:radical SAM protein [Clostridium cellulovorans]ADL53788.1 Radical SAM domain protein [Clostridium cellulovorans 743B]
MINQPITSVWEITMGCNMRCKHCGSICENPLPDELTTEEALDLCRQLGELGMQYITLSGGEPTTRKDWHLIAKELTKNGVIPNIITNGWLVTEEIAKLAAEAGVGTVAISLDGLEEHHDYMRKPGSFARSSQSLKYLKDAGIATSVITTISTENLLMLGEMKEKFIEMGVSQWQLQIALPMGSFKDRKETTLAPSQIDDVINFAYETMLEDRIAVDLADCLGYFNIKEIKVRQKRAGNENAFWTGCGAGKTSFGILHNGDIVGCTSIREQKYIEGNIRETSLKDIWEKESNFAWNREMSRDKLSGVCKTCTYGDYCHGGCSNTRISIGGDMYAENTHCSYNYAVACEMKKLSDNIDTLKAQAEEYLKESNFEMVLHACERLISKDESEKLLSDYALAAYMTGNYKLCVELNDKILNKDSNHVYGLKGLGLALCKLERIEEGIENLKKASELSPEGYVDPYHDYIIVLFQLGRIEEAKEVLKKAQEKHKQCAKELAREFKEIMLA